MTSDVIFSIGSNFGDRQSTVASAISEMFLILSDPQSSLIYETPDIHGGTARYMNAVVSGKCDLDLNACGKFCKDLEIAYGRDADARAGGVVPLDVDIVVWNGQVLRPRDYRQNFFTIGLAQISDGSFPS